MQRKTLYIHLGTHRTATSSIQEYLHSNFDALVAQGVLYPLGVRRHVHLVNNLFSGRRNPLELAHDLLQRAESKPTAIHSIILSDEDIAMRRNLSIFAQMQEVFDVKFVYCLRRQDIWLESWYMQNVKWQWDKTLAHITFPEFCNRISDFHWIDYDNYLSHLESLVGKENVITYVFERRDMPRGPVQAFADLVGIDSRNLPPPPHSNASFSPLLVEFSRRLPMEKAPPALRKKHSPTHRGSTPWPTR